jgi:hypothetical protein
MGSTSEGRDEKKLILPAQYQGNTVRPKFIRGEI